DTARARPATGCRPAIGRRRDARAHRGVARPPLLARRGTHPARARRRLTAPGVYPGPRGDRAGRTRSRGRALPLLANDGDAGLSRTQKKKQRTLSFNRAVGALHVCQDGEEVGYFVDELAHDFGPGVRCFRVSKIIPPADDSPREYDVLIGG